MKRIAAICAYNRRNCGMYSVDLAARDFFGRNGIECDLWLTQPRRRVGALRFRHLRAPSDLEPYDAVVYWGDFQNNPMWGANDFARRHVRRGQARTAVEAFETWKRFYLLLKEQLPAGVPIFAFGGCFMGMEPYLDDSRTRSAMEAFFRDAAGVVVRDALSHDLVTREFGGTAGHDVQLGFDVACLLTLAARPRRRAKRYFVYDFGRSNVEREMGSLVRELASELRIDAVPLNWLEPGWGGVTHGRFVRNIERISDAAFVLTDIYHLCINSFCRGTVPICIARAGAVPDGTLSDVKKDVLFKMLDCPDLLLKVSEKGSVSEIRARLLTTAAGLAAGTASRPEAFEALDRRSRQLESMILEAIGRSASRGPMAGVGVRHGSPRPSGE